MARRIFEENIRVWWVTSIASTTAPTVAEINAGTDITAFLTKDGLKLGISNNMVDNSDLSSAMDAQIIGTYGAKPVLKFFRDDTTDTAWNLFQTRGGFGNIVVRRLLPYATALATTQKVDVWPAQTSLPQLEDTAANTRQMFSVALAVTGKPQLAAVVS